MLDNILIALQSLRANKMRALLTMLGIIIGIGSVIAIETVGNSLSGSISSSMSGFGASDITIALEQKESDDENTSGNTRIRMFMPSSPDADDRITDAMVEEYRTAFSDKVAYIKLSESVGSGQIGFSDDTASVSVLGVNDEYFSAEEVELLHGRFINNEKDAGKKLCVLSEDFIEEYMNVRPSEAVGESLAVQISRKSYTFYILGVYAGEEDEEEESTYSTTNFYIPLSTAKDISGAAEGYESITVVTAVETDTNAFMTTSENYFASYYTRNDAWTVSASSMEELLSTMTEMIDTVALAISAIAAISLLVGGIGVMNIMLVSVTERTKEIGTRKALGARGRTIRFQFIVESVVICMIGGALGILLGVGLGAVASNIMGYSAQADTGAIVLVVGISVAIGVFFGYYPANKASKLDPIEALRYE